VLHARTHACLLACTQNGGTGIMHQQHPQPPAPQRSKQAPPRARLRNFSLHRTPRTPAHLEQLLHLGLRRGLRHALRVPAQPWADALVQRLAHGGERGRAHAHAGRRVARDVALVERGALLLQQDVSAACGRKAGGGRVRAPEGGRVCMRAQERAHAPRRQHRHHRQHSQATHMSQIMSSGRSS